MRFYDDRNVDGETVMKSLSILAATALVALTLTDAPAAVAQGAPQVVAPMKVSVDVGRLAMGYRASKIKGAGVYNDANQKVGTIDDLIVNRDDTVLYAIVSVGGFLGMGNHLVAVPYNVLRIEKDRMMLPGATKDALKAMPEFKYARS
jgi:hypothetical protein